MIDRKLPAGKAAERNQKVENHEKSFSNCIVDGNLSVFS
jgi:hypothetical protein